MSFRGFRSLDGLRTYVRIVRNDADQASKIRTQPEASEAITIVREHAERLRAALAVPQGFDDGGHAEGVRDAANDALIDLSACDAEDRSDLLRQQRDVMARFRDAISALGLLDDAV